MATQRAIRGVLSNFLGTYTSRYTDFGGYWLFGFVVGELTELRIDLRMPVESNSSTPLGALVNLAVVKFADQLYKAGLADAQVRDASLTVTRSTDQVVNPVNGRPSTGYNLRFVATATMVSGKLYQCEQIVFVAPHNPCNG